MKKWQAIFIFIFLGVVLFVKPIKAEIRESDLDRLRLAYTETRISIMSEAEKLDKLANYDLEHAKQVTKNFKGVSNGNNRGYTWYEVSDYEYDHFNPTTSPVDPVAEYETVMKKVKLVATPYGSGTNHDVYLHAFWKKIPNIRTFDVLGFRFQNTARLVDSEYGHQFYRLRGHHQFSSVDYQSNGTNIKKQFQGFGISMNLVNDDIVEIELEIGCDAIITSTGPYIFGTYQHATDNLTLAKSKMYNISSAGNGGVLNFYPTIDPYYDNMSGVYVSLA